MSEERKAYCAGRTGICHAADCPSANGDLCDRPLPPAPVVPREGVLTREIRELIVRCEEEIHAEHMGEQTADVQGAWVELRDAILALSGSAARGREGEG